MARGLRKGTSVFIDQIFAADAIPALAKGVQFAARRQELVAHNIANVSTPGFQQVDVSVEGFRAALAQAVDRRRAAPAGTRGDLEFPSTREVQVDERGGLRLTPQTPSGNILFHDRNNRDIERLMQDLVENVAAFRMATDLLRGRVELINAAIRERLS